MYLASASWMIGTALFLRFLLLASHHLVCHADTGAGSPWDRRVNQDVDILVPGHSVQAITKIPSPPMKAKSSALFPHLSPLHALRLVDQLCPCPVRAVTSSCHVARTHGLPSSGGSYWSLHQVAPEAKRKVESCSAEYRESSRPAASRSVLGEARVGFLGRMPEMTSAPRVRSPF